MSVGDLCAKAKYASFSFSSSATEQKNRVLSRLKELLFINEEELLRANALDSERAKAAGKGAAYLDRLALSPARIRQMAEGLDAIIALPDPVGEIVESVIRPNGLKIDRVRAPLGVIGIIFEARPNVAVDAAALCIKSGNGVILRGSRDSTESVGRLVGLIRQALMDTGLSPDIVGLIEGADRALTVEMLRQEKFIDVVIPRGGEELKKVVLANAVMPVIASSGGNCHMYIASDADKDMAIRLAINAKCSRPSTCNALETLLIDREFGTEYIKEMLASLYAAGVEIRGTKEILSLSGADCEIKEADEEEFYREYDDLIIKVKAVSGIQEAIDHINKYGTRHSDAIVTSDQKKAEKFMREVDSAAVYVNASTRFTDGFEFGLGAEMGISTQKLHVRGPIGLRELTSVKYTVTGNGQIRQ
jgi:glutamate-5-semialdehyde dehydrogenase